LIQPYKYKIFVSVGTNCAGQKFLSFIWRLEVHNRSKVFITNNNGHKFEYYVIRHTHDLHFWTPQSYHWHSKHTKTSGSIIKYLAHHSYVLCIILSKNRIFASGEAFSNVKIWRESYRILLKRQSTKLLGICCINLYQSSAKTYHACKSTLLETAL